MSAKREITSFFAPKAKRTRNEDKTTNFHEIEEENEAATSSPPTEVVAGVTGGEGEERSVENLEGELKVAANEAPINDHENVTDVVRAPRASPPLFDLGSWSDLLESEFSKTYFKNLMKYVDREYSSATVYPPRDQMFTAFNTCNLNELKVVIIGQDPYHGPNQAHGLAFSVLEGNAPPPSLRNIFKEARTDVGISQPKHGNLTCWSRQGVFLLNNVLTVRSAEPNSHQNKGWEEFTDAVIRELNKRDRLIFILWGKPAQTKCKSINNKKHLIITSSHPSPLGATKTKEPFIGSRCFSRCNHALQEMGKDPINWEII